MINLELQLCARIGCGAMISSMSFNDSFVLLKCFRLAPNEKFCGKLYLDMLRSVFPPVEEAWCKVGNKTLGPLSKCESERKKVESLI